MTNMLVVILHDLSRLPALLQAWKKIGVPGVTLMNSIGGFQAESWLDRIGFGWLREQDDVHQRILISVISDPELLERAISEADRVVEGFDRPHSGILFTLPVSHTLGIRKRGYALPQPDPIAANLLVLDRSAPVSEIVHVMDLDPVLVQADAGLQDVAEQVMAQPRVHVVCVVNSEQRLMGLIDIASLADALFFQVFPEEFLSELRDLDEVMDYAQRTHVHYAEDLMRESVWVKMDDTLERAFQLMHENKLTGLPVIDDHYHVVGYINLLELMAVCLRTNKSQEDAA